MLRYVYDQDLLVADFVARAKIASGHTKRAGFPDMNLRAIGIIVERNELIAGIVYFNYNPEAGTIEMSVEALPKQRWLTPTTLGVNERQLLVEGTQHAQLSRGGGSRLRGSGIGMSGIAT